MTYAKMSAPSSTGAMPPLAPEMAGPFRWPLMIGETLIQWRNRAVQRRRLRHIDDWLLFDIGLTRADAEQESGKPFWLA